MKMQRNTGNSKYETDNQIIKQAFNSFTPKQLSKLTDKAIDKYCNEK